MKKTMGIVMASVFALACAAGAAFAAGGKVASVDGDKVTVEAKGHGLANGAGGVTVKGAAGSVMGKVTAVSGDKVTIQVRQGKASTLKKGESVTVEGKKAGGEEMQGC
jgi:hypothetical protein